MKHAVVLPAQGIGDALLMMIASHQLKMAGYEVTTFHDALPGLAPWFPGHTLLPLPEKIPPCDLIIAENDNSPRIKELIANHRPHLSLFYPTYLVSKHAPLSPYDRVFHPHLPMVENIAAAIASLLSLPATSRNNGISPSPNLSFRSKKQQILIHPTSRHPEKNWKAHGFVQVAHALKKKGLYPLFCLSPKEAPDWEWIKKEGCHLTSPATLAALATLVYESGYVIGNDSLMGHLASNLNIPTLIIANDEKRMRLWRPGWLKGELVFPPSFLPNWKFLRLKNNHWQTFIPAHKVLKSFHTLLQTL